MANSRCVYERWMFPLFWMLGNSWYGHSKSETLELGLYQRPAYVFQLRVIRAFKSTLEDLEERRSVHSLHSLRSSRSHTGPRPLSDITYIDEDPVKTPSPYNNSFNNPRLNNSTLAPTSEPYRFSSSNSLIPDLSKIPHETSI